MHTPLREYGKIIVLFSKIGATTFGGGYAMLPLLQRELVDKRQWLSEAELLDCYALAQCLPGIIFVNVITLIMQPRFGTAKAVLAAFSSALPSLLIILLLATLLQQFSHLPVVQHAFAGLRIGVAATLVWALWRLVKSGVRDILAGVLMAAAFGLLFLGVNPIFIVLGAAAAGVLWQTFQSRKAGQP